MMNQGEMRALIVKVIIPTLDPALADLERLEERLVSFSFDFNLPTIVFSECALTYIPEESVSALIKFVGERIARCHFLTYEQVSPHDSFGEIMKAHFDSRNSPLRNVDVYPDTADQVLN